MNFKRFYNNIENKLQSSITSLWATGDAEMQQYFTYLFQQEGLISKPIFQNMFPWETTGKTFGDCNDLFPQEFINALGKEDFPKAIQPYKHQLKSWESLLQHKKSIAVTTGTGSGKTECFMLPVLADLYQNCRNEEGINAIFLYPLNALIGSQEKRLGSWCKTLGGLKFAVYNGTTTDTAPKKEKDEALPKIIDRATIRKNPPQILFTNPTMLEYILVRNKDKELLEKSKGKLRWILLDEAHTLAGSSATEMALLIRRIIDAFGVNANDLRFAITSATVGEDNDAEIVQFMTKLCGIKKENINIIKGKRVLNNIESNTPENIKNLRQQFLNKDFLTTEEIGKHFNQTGTNSILDTITSLSTKNEQNEAVLPTRGHFFTRGIGGVYVCTNNNCSEHKNAKPASALGTMYTKAKKNCSCGAPLLELVACRSCGSYLLQGESYQKTNHKNYVRQKSAAQTTNLFEMEDDEEEFNNRLIDNNAFYLTKNTPPFALDDYTQISIQKDGEIDYNGDEFAQTADKCPHCASSLNIPMHFRNSSAMMNRTLAEIILNEVPEAETQTAEMLYKGKKYLSFTDSRQGTARNAANLNQDSERNWLRTKVYHIVANANKTDNEYDENDIEAGIQYLEQQLQNTLPIILQESIQKDINKLKTKLKDKLNNASTKSVSWKDMIQEITDTGNITNSDLKKMYDRGNVGQRGSSYTNDAQNYVEAMLMDEFARRVPRSRSLENIGLVNLVYPKIQNLTQTPNICNKLNIHLNEWKSLLKIACDYVLRNQIHYPTPVALFPFMTSFVRIGKEIVPSDSTLNNITKWVQFDKNATIQNKLSLLICAGLGFTDLNDIDNRKEDEINELLTQIWQTLVGQEILKQGDNGYILNLKKQTEFQPASTVWLCPVKKRLIDAHFKCISPWIKGNLTRENVEHFRINKEVQFPLYNFNQTATNEDIQQWIDNIAQPLKQQGVWSDLHTDIFTKKRLYLAGEHSAQQKYERLKTLEKQFEEGKINILNCSTTMEMGVDIGGISAVMMSNVPPAPANYLQRAGRAGRRAESQSLALTICPPSPVGMSVFEDPNYFRSSTIASPIVSFDSPTIVQRHVNAFFLGKFIQSKEFGLNLDGKVNDFFFPKEGQPTPIAQQFLTWLTDLSMIDPIKNQALIQSLQAITRNTSLANKPFNTVHQKVYLLFEQLVHSIHLEVNKLNKKLEEYPEKSPAHKAIEFQKNQFIDKNAVQFLAEKNFIPSAGIPTGVVNFDTLNIADLKTNTKTKKREDSPSYHITRALTEFAPGNTLVLDGKAYKSAGITMEDDFGNQSTRHAIQNCSNCGHTKTYEQVDNQTSTLCEHCNTNSMKGITLANGEAKAFTEIIEPTGFAVDLFTSPNRNISKQNFTSYVDPLLINVEPWGKDETTPFQLRTGKPGALSEILYYNTGSGNGYSVCLHCGRASTDAAHLENHKRLRGGKDINDSPICEGNEEGSFAIRHNVMLTGRIQTNYTEIKLKDANGAFITDNITLNTLGVTFTKALAKQLGIEENEIAYGIKQYDNYSTIYIFDTAKGGAGYSSQFSFHIYAILQKSIQFLTCTCNSACTSCLLDRESQRKINYLDRNIALEWLNYVSSLKVNDDILAEYPTIEIVPISMRDEMSNLNAQQIIKQAWFVVNHEAGNYQQDNYFTFFANTPKHFIVNNNIQWENNNELISYIQACIQGEFYYHAPTTNSLKTICYIQLTTGEIYEYLAHNFNNNLNTNWGVIKEGNLFKQKVDALPNLELLNIPTPSATIHQTKIASIQPIPTTKIAEILVNNSPNQMQAFQQKMQEKTFTITYTDSFITKPLDVIIIADFIDYLATYFKIEIESITYNMSNKVKSDFSEPRFLHHAFNNATTRNEFLQHYTNACFRQLGNSNITIQEGNNPHFRFLEFKHEDLTVTIRPDAGLAWRWYTKQNYSYADYKTGTTIQVMMNQNDENLCYLLSE